MLNEIKLIITDIDGVWTDGGMYYTIEGQSMLKFNVKDGLGVKKLQSFGIETAIITGNTTEIIRTRAEKLNIKLVYLGAENKLEAFDDICKLRGIKKENIAFIGDDENDLQLIEASAITAAPADAVKIIKDKVDFICERKGGEGAFREFADFLIKK